MGLFDSAFGSTGGLLGNLDDPQQAAQMSMIMGLLQAGGPSRTPIGLGQAFAHGLGAGQQGFQQAQEAQTNKALRDMKMKTLGIGMEKDALELQQTRDAMERQKRIRERTMGLLKPGATPAADEGAQLPQAIASAAPGGEMSPKVGGPDWLQAYQAQNPQQLGQSQPQTKPQRNQTRAFTDQLIAKANIYAEEGDDATALKMYEQATKFMPKVKDWKQVNIGGKVMYAPYFEDGTPGEPVPYEVAEKLHFANTGGFTVGQNPFTGQVVSSIKNTRSPDSLASEATQRWVHGTPSATSQLTAMAGRVPPGYRMTADGNMEAIPGGPADAKSGAEAVKREKMIESGLNKANIVIGKVDEALKKTGVMTTGLTGKALSFVPGTEAYDLDKTIDTIKANIGFQELQAMREASPTGGALGAVAVRELDFLQSVLASLDVGQSKPQQIRNLQAVKQHYENWRSAVDQSRGMKQSTGGASGDWDGVPQDVRGLVNKYTGEPPVEINTLLQKYGGK